MAAVDRVRERRKAAGLARHHRDQEGLSIAEIARMLGRAKSTVKAYLYDRVRVTKDPDAHDRPR
jgi:transcriptional regulator with XRE-family HTH domain